VHKADENLPTPPGMTSGPLKVLARLLTAGEEERNPRPWPPGSD